MEVFHDLDRGWERFSTASPTPFMADEPKRNRETVMAVRGMQPGDEVVFARLDLAETLGIWRNATGRVVGIHPASGRAPTVDVKFEGHETLEEYLPAMFRRVN